MANLECFIDFDDEWLQEDCHWTYDRIFTITWKITGASSIISKTFSYRIGKYDYTPVYQPTERSLGNDTKIWTYELRLSTIDNSKLLNARTSEGWLNLAAKLSAMDASGATKEVSATYDYYLELPPKQVENLETSLVVNNPGELKCSWKAASTINNNDADSVDGYTVEMKRCLASDDSTKDANYFYVGNLAWDETELANGKYKLILTEDTRDLSVPEIDGEFDTYVNTVINTEVYINGATSTEFYFKPEQLGLEKGDYYKFIIYPHSHYSSEHTLITPEGTESAVREVPKGIVRVFNGTTWVEGEVWVMVYDEAEQKNVWKVADSIYVLADDGNGGKTWKITA